MMQCNIRLPSVTSRKRYSANSREVVRVSDRLPIHPQVYITLLAPKASDRHPFILNCSKSSDFIFPQWESHLLFLYSLSGWSPQPLAWTHRMDSATSRKSARVRAGRLWALQTALVDQRFASDILLRMIRMGTWLMKSASGQTKKFR